MATGGAASPTLPAAHPPCAAGCFFLLLGKDKGGKEHQRHGAQRGLYAAGERRRAAAPDGRRQPPGPLGGAGAAEPLRARRADLQPAAAGHGAVGPRAQGARQPGAGENGRSCRQVSAWALFCAFRSRVRSRTAVADRLRPRGNVPPERPSCPTIRRRRLPSACSRREGLPARVRLHPGSGIKNRVCFCKPGFPLVRTFTTDFIKKCS